MPLPGGPSSTSANQSQQHLAQIGWLKTTHRRSPFSNRREAVAYVQKATHGGLRGGSRKGQADQCKSASLDAFKPSMAPVLARISCKPVKEDLSDWHIPRGILESPDRSTWAQIDSATCLREICPSLFVELQTVPDDLRDLHEQIISTGNVPCTRGQRAIWHALSYIQSGLDDLYLGMNNAGALINFLDAMKDFDDSTPVHLLGLIQACVSILHNRQERRSFAKHWIANRYNLRIQARAKAERNLEGTAIELPMTYLQIAELSLGDAECSWYTPEECCKAAVAKLDNEPGFPPDMLSEAMQLYALIQFARGRQIYFEELLAQLPLVWRIELQNVVVEATSQKADGLDQGTANSARLERGLLEPNSPSAANRIDVATIASFRNLSLEEAQHGPVRPSILKSAPSDEMLNAETSSADSAEPMNSSEGELSFIGQDDDSSSNERADDNPTKRLSLWIQQFAEYLVTRCLARTTAAGENSSSAPRGGSTANTSQGNTEATELPTRVSRSQGTRKLEHKDCREDDEDDGANNSKRKLLNSAEGVAKILACPYAKFNRERYSEQNQEEKCYHGCASKYLPNITRVKQHLYRTHKRPDWYCPTCYESFKARNTLNMHLQGRSCEAREERYQEKMTDEQFEAVKRRAKGNDARQSWFQIFAILFPDAPRPTSPYVSTSNPEVVREFVQFFRAYGAQEFYNFLRNQQQAMGEYFVPPAYSTQAAIDEAFEEALPEYLRQVTAEDEVTIDPDQDMSSSRPCKRVRREIAASSASEDTAESREPPMLPPDLTSTEREGKAPAIIDDEIPPDCVDPALLAMDASSDPDFWPFFAPRLDPAVVDAFEAYVDLSPVVNSGKGASVSFEHQHATDAV